MFPGKFTRYILWDVLKMFMLALVAMTVVISLVFVGHTLIEKGLGWFALAKLMPFIILMSLQYAVPPTLLFSVCCVYGRISADNEIIALKSAGISPNRIYRPALVLGLLLSIPAVWLNDVAVSWGRPSMEKIILRSVEEILYRGLRSHRSYNSEKGFSIHVQDVQDRWLIEPTIIMYNETTGKPMTISAVRAQISIDAANDKMIIELVDSYIQVNDEKTTKIKWPGSQRVDMPLMQASRGSSDTVSPSQFSVSQIPAEIQKQNGANDRRREALATNVTMALAMGRFENVHSGTVAALEGELSDSQRKLARLKTEPARRWALGFSCLFFVWIGVPMAILVRSADYWWTFGVCFVPILLIYYPLFGLALDMAKDGSWPASSLWLGNIVLMLIGSWMMRKVNRT